MFLFPYDTQICHFGNVVEIDTFVNISSNGVFKDDLYSASNEFHLKSTETKRITWQVGRMTCTQNIIFRSCSQHACVLTPRKYHQNIIIVSAMNNFRPRLSGRVVTVAGDFGHESISANVREVSGSTSAANQTIFSRPLEMRLAASAQLLTAFVCFNPKDNTSKYNNSQCQERIPSFCRITSVQNCVYPIHYIIWTWIFAQGSVV